MVSPSVQWDGRNYPYVAPEKTHDRSRPQAAHCCQGKHRSCHLRSRAPRYVEHECRTRQHHHEDFGLAHLRLRARLQSRCLLDEIGDFVFFGPFLQYLGSATTSAIKWTLENRSTNPGIEDGDIFLTNDPWIGATHQSDVTLIAPLFWEGKLFCWVGNTLHQWDLGGTSPGGFNPQAPDIFWEAGCIPPVKIVEKGRLRRDIEEEYIRRSRMPQLVALDLRAEIAGCNVARERMLSLIKRYGPETIKGVIRKLQNDSEKAFLTRLKTIPDGTWREVGCIEMANTQDRHIYRNAFTLTKQGNKLIFSNEGTDPQSGTLNCTMVAWKGAIASMICAQMLFDQMFVVEGAYRHCEFNATPGTLTCASYPAAVSAAPALTLLQTIALAGLVISKMLACSSDPELRKEVQCMGAAMYPVAAFNGIDQRKSPFASFLLDPVGAALTGLSWRDGVDTGDWPWDLQSTMPNVEEHERFYPILYLWRRELKNASGAGKFRGGNSAELAFIPHKTDRLTFFTATGHAAVPPPGLFGGSPPSTNRYTIKRDARVRSYMSETGKMPDTLEDLPGKIEYLAPKSFNIFVLPDDVFVLAWAGAGGYGDPLERDPESVRRDLVNGSVTAGWAKQAYGVVFDQTGKLDKAATDRTRDQLRAGRLANAPKKEHFKANVDGARQVAEGLLLVGIGSEAFLACAKCHTRISSARDNYKLHCVTESHPVTAANPHILDPNNYIDDSVVFQTYVCPGCGLLIQTEILRPGDELLWDLQLGEVKRK